MHHKAQLGDEHAIQLFSEFGKHVGQMVKSILYVYDPDIIIMGGSVSNAFNFFKTSMYREIENFAYRNTLRNLNIVISEMEDSAILGAAALPMNG
jgi:glucokinase